jgi:hypothetical protein
MRHSWGSLLIQSAIFVYRDGGVYVRSGRSCQPSALASPPKPSYGRIHSRYAQCRADRFCASIIGTFACRTNQRKTKASKRANFRTRIGDEVNLEYGR